MFSAFRQSNINFTKSIELLEKISPFEEFITMNDNIIGKKEVDINDYKNFINKLDNKIEKKTFGKEYYMAYKKSSLEKIMKNLMERNVIFLIVMKRLQKF